MIIKAIQAEYSGITFRSRLEARWAMFFDGIGVEWHYEYEGFQLSSGWYVPDFWLPKVRSGSKVGVFVEVKPFQVNDPRLADVEEETSEKIFMVVGNPRLDNGHLMKCAFCGEVSIGHHPFGITCRDCWCSRVSSEEDGSRPCGILEAMEAAEDEWEEAPKRCGPISGRGWSRDGNGLIINCEYGPFYCFREDPHAVYTYVQAQEHHERWLCSITIASQAAERHRFH